MYKSVIKTVMHAIQDSLFTSYTPRTSDQDYSFDSILFYGHFWNLFQLDLLIFAVVDLLSHNYLLAAIITFIISWVSPT